MNAPRLFLAFLLVFPTGFVVAQSKSALFLGNSYTAYNALPSMVSQLASSGGKTLTVGSNTPGGYTLGGHLSNATSQNLLTSQAWDYLILQEQSQIPTISPYKEASVINAGNLAFNLRNNSNGCGRVLMYLTWGRRFGGQQCDGSGTNCSPAFVDFDHMQDSLTANYQRAAFNANAEIAPVGEAWRMALDSGSVVLHTPDNSHPSLAGSYLAACTFYASIYQESPEGLSYTAGLDSATARFLQRMAASTVLPKLDTYHLRPFGLPHYDAQISGSVLTTSHDCGETDWRIRTTLTLNGIKPGAKSVHLAVAWNKDGQFSHSDTLKVPILDSCGTTLNMLDTVLNLPSNGEYSAVVGIIDTNEKFPYRNTFVIDTFLTKVILKDSGSHHLEDFSPSSSRKDRFLHHQWSVINEDSSLSNRSDFGRIPAPDNTGGIPMEGIYLAYVRSDGIGRDILVSNCHELQGGSAYTLEALFMNNTLDANSGAGFHVLLSDDALFSTSSVIDTIAKKEFGYVNTPTLWKDTFFVAQSGTYYFGYELDSIQPNAVGVLALDSIVITNIGAACPLLPLPAPTALADSICPGESYFFNGQPLTSSGVYRDTISTVFGCDSMLTLDLVVLDTTTITILDTSITQGDSLLWQGTQYSKAGIYYDTLMSISGCDSVIGLELNITTTLVSESQLRTFQVFPNPVKDYLTISGLPEEAVVITLFDLSGKQIDRSTATSSASLELDFTKYEAGVYLLQIQGKNTLFYARVVKE